MTQSSVSVCLFVYDWFVQRERSLDLLLRPHKFVVSIGFDTVARKNFSYRAQGWRHGTRQPVPGGSHESPPSCESYERFSFDKGKDTR